MPSLKDATQSVDTTKLTQVQTPAAQNVPAPEIDNAPARNQFLRSPLPPTNANPDSLRQYYRGGQVPQFRSVTPPTIQQKGSKGATGSTGATGATGPQGPAGKSGSSAAARVTIPLILTPPQPIAGFWTINSSGGLTNGSFACKITSAFLNGAAGSSFSVAFQAGVNGGASGPTIKPVIKRTLPGSTTVIDTTAITVAGATTFTVPSGAPGPNPPPLLWSDFINVPIDANHDYWIVWYDAAAAGVEYGFNTTFTATGLSYFQHGAADSTDHTGDTTISFSLSETAVLIDGLKVAGPSIIGGTTYVGTLPLGLTFTLLETKMSKPSRVRLYSSATAQTADINRDVNTNPTAFTAHGLIYEQIADNTYTYPLTWQCSPEAPGSDCSAFPVGNIEYTVNDLSGTSAQFEIDFTILKQEGT